MNTDHLFVLVTALISIAGAYMLVVNSEPVRRRLDRRADALARRALEEYAREVGARVDGVVEEGSTPWIWWVHTRAGLHARFQIITEPDGTPYTPRRGGGMEAPRAQFVWSGATWWPDDAVLRPPRRTYFEWRDGLPGEAADVTVGARSYVAEGASARERDRLEAALAHAPGDGALFIEDATVSVFMDTPAAPDAEAMAAAARAWQAYLSARWSRGA